MLLESPRCKCDADTAAFGLVDPENGNGLMLCAKAGGLFSVEVDPEQLALVADAGLRILLTRRSRNNFDLTIVKGAIV